MFAKDVCIIVALDQEFGYDKNGKHPWILKSDLKYFANLTKFTEDSLKKNAVIMGADVWGHIPKRPLPLRKNVVVTSEPENLIPEATSDVLVCQNLNNAIEKMENDDDIETIWIIGGIPIFNDAVDHPSVTKIFMTEIQKTFQCDVFFPKFMHKFALIDNYDDKSGFVLKEKQEENDLTYFFKVYKKN